MLRAAAEAYTEWSETYADGVLWDEADAAASGEDYSEHHADVSAASEIGDILNQQFADLIIDVDTSDEPAREESTVGARVDLNRLHNLAETARARAAADTRATAPRRDGRSWYRIENRAAADGAGEIAEVFLYDMIGDWGITAQEFVNDLRGIKAAALDLHVNCEGGEVFDGLAIYETLRRHPAAVTAYVDGIAASSASFVVQAADKIVMAPRGKMMIHDAHGIVMGNARDMREMATLLDDLSDTIADIYAERTNMTRAQWRTAMAAAEGGPDGTWYDAAAAVKVGLADEITGGAPVAAASRAEFAARLFDVPVELVDVPTGTSTAELATWQPRAFLDALDEISNPPQPVNIPDGQALRSLFDLQ